MSRTMPKRTVKPVQRYVPAETVVLDDFDDTSDEDMSSISSSSSEYEPTQEDLDFVVDDKKVSSPSGSSSSEEEEEAEFTSDEKEIPVCKTCGRPLPVSSDSSSDTDYSDEEV